MRNCNRFQLERADFKAFTRLENIHRDFRRTEFRLALGFKQASREWRCIDGRLQTRPEIEQCAVVVFVRMRDDDAAQIVLFSFEKTNIRENKVRARMFRSGKAYAHVDHDPFTIVFRAKAIHGEVHADFADTAERQEDKLRRW